MYDELALDTVSDRKTALFIIGVGAVGLFLYKKIGGGKKPAKTNGPDPDEYDDESEYNLSVEEDEPDEPDEE